MMRPVQNEISHIDKTTGTLSLVGFSSSKKKITNPMSQATAVENGRIPFQDKFRKYHLANLIKCNQKLSLLIYKEHGVEFIMSYHLYILLYLTFYL